MKVHAFRFYQHGVADIDAVLHHVNALPYEQRLRTVMNSDIRLEAAFEARSGWALDFSVARRDGPGRIGRDRPIESFELDEDDGFGEETAAYLDRTSLFCAVQYNHYGPKARHIQGYLTQFAREISRTPASAAEDRCSVVVAPVLRDNAAERLMNKTIIRRIEFQIYVPEAEDAPGNRSLTSFLDAPITSGAKNISVQISAGREGNDSLPVRAVKAFANDVLGLGGDLKKLKIKAKDDEDSPTEPLDFVADRLEKEYSIVPNAVSRRYDRNERWQYVTRSHQEWAASGELR